MATLNGGPWSASSIRPASRLERGRPAHVAHQLSHRAGALPAQAPGADRLAICRELRRDHPIYSVVVRQAHGRELDKLKRGNERRARPLHGQILDLVREAWVLTSVEYQASKIRSGYVLAASFSHQDLSSKIAASAPALANIDGDKLIKEAATLVKGTAEDQFESVEFTGGEPGAAPGKVRRRLQDAVARPVHDQPDRAGQEGRDRPGHRPRRRDPPDGRHPDPPPAEQPDPHRRGRRRQDGRRRGLRPAHRRGRRARRRCKNVAVRTLDLGLLQAGAGVKGEFENRLKQVIAEVKASPDADHPVHRRGAHA